MTQVEAEPALSARNYTRAEKLILFDRPPKPTDTVDTIVVLGGLPNGPAFSKRLALLDLYKNIYPNSQVVFTGDGRSRRGLMGETRTEAEVWAEEAIKRGLEEERILKEGLSDNAKENVDFSLTLAGGSSRGMLFLSSHLMGKRVDYYLRKNLESVRRANPYFKHFIIDADVPKGPVELTDEEANFRRSRIMYEWERLSKYRKSRDL